MRPITNVKLTKIRTILEQINLFKPMNLINTGDTAWLLISTVLVLMMTLPGLMLFYAGMVRKKSALSVMVHIFVGMAVVSLIWAMVAYSLAFTDGNEYLGGDSKIFVSQLIGAKVQTHVLAPTVPESAFFLFQMAFAIIAFALITGSTAERMKLRATALFAALWTIAVYAPVAHWVWQPSGWLASLGHLDFAGGTVVHITAGFSGLVAAKMIGPRIGFGQEPMIPNNLMITVIGAGLLWAGWFGFNAGSAFHADGKAVNALIVTQVAACVAALVWGFCEWLRRKQTSLLGVASGGIAGLIGITPASGYVGITGAVVIGIFASVACFVAVNKMKSLSGTDDALDVFALHGVGGLVGTILTPMFATGKSLDTILYALGVNTLGALVVAIYSVLMTFIALWIINKVVGLRVSADEEKVGLDLTQHGEMI
jgi:ammonium transporter, Amt family